MAWTMRNSKFRHVFGKALKREQCYDNIRVTRSSWEAPYCSVNPKYVAIVTEAAGGGSFIVIPLAKVGRVERDGPIVSGHRDAVLDVAWCPHNDDVIASCGDDCSVRVWQIPDGGLTENLNEPIVELNAHQKRVGQIIWHPSAHNILLSAGCDNMIYIWNVEVAEIITEIQFNDIPYCTSFNYNGSKIAVTAKDKKLRVFDTRTGDMLQEGASHSGTKPARCVYLKNGIICTTGFSKMAERQYALWNEKDLSSPIENVGIDKSNGVMFPFYDADTGMIYICGKGDTIIRYYELGETDNTPTLFYLNLYQAKDPQKGLGFMPKRALNVNACEIARVYKLHNSGLCEVIPFTVPRKSELFQEDLYPDTFGDTPALEAAEWIAGKDADPILISLKGGYVSTKKEVSKVVRKSNVFDKKPALPARSSTGATIAATSSNDNEAAAATPALPPMQQKTLEKLKGFDPDKLVKDVKALQDIVAKQETRIKQLEERLTSFEMHTDEEDVGDHEEDTGDQC